jgi:predicted nucleic acid-binding protein
MILVDTSVWSLALRRKSKDLAAWEIRLTETLFRIVNENRAQMVGVVRQELLSGIREESQFRRLRDYLRDFPDAAVETEDYEEAARAGNRCRQSGIASSPIDMILCAVALHQDWEIFTSDRDFLRYSAVLKIRLLSAA